MENGFIRHAELLLRPFHSTIQTAVFWAYMQNHGYRERCFMNILKMHTCPSVTFPDLKIFILKLHVKKSRQIRDMIKYCHYIPNEITDCNIF